MIRIYSTAIHTHSFLQEDLPQESYADYKDAALFVILLQIKNPYQISLIGAQIKSYTDQLLHQHHLFC